MPAVAVRRTGGRESRRGGPAGATAAKALLGNDFRLTAHRQEALRLPAGDDVPPVVATVHPSSILRGPHERRDEAFEALVDDLRFAASLLPNR